MNQISLVQLGLSFFAGMLTVLSPCVFPAIPMVAASSLGAHRFGPFALALGLAVSFTAIGVGVAAFGIDVGVDGQMIRKLAAFLIFAAGLVLISTRAQQKLSSLLSPIGLHADRWSRRLPTKGLFGQFGLGCLLGAIWSPCSGPLLGAAIGMAATQGSRTGGATLMFSFGLGSSLPLLFASYASRTWMMKRKGGLVKFGERAKTGIGIVLIFVALSILSGADRVLEAWLLERLPEKWIEVITHF